MDFIEVVVFFVVGGGRVFMYIDGEGGVFFSVEWEFGVFFFLLSRFILRILNVSIDVLIVNGWVKGRWDVGVLEGREELGGRKK